MSRRCCLARRLAHCAARPLPAAAVPACSTLPAHRQAYLAELVAHEDDRMAWRATEFAVKLVGSGVVPGQLYPIAFSLELLLEIIGFVVPLGVVSVSYKLITTLNLAASAKKE